MKNFTKNLKLRFISCVFIFLFGMIFAQAQSSTSSAGFNISLVSNSYNATTGKTTFAWRIEQSGSTTGISHMDMASLCLSGSVYASEISYDGVNWSSTTLLYADGSASSCTKPESLIKFSGDGTKRDNYFRLTMNGRYDTTTEQALLKFGNGNPTTGNGYTTTGCSSFNIVVPIAVAKYSQITKCQDQSTTDLTATAGADSYKWLSPDGSVTTSTNNKFSISNLPAKSGTYKVIYTKDGCKKSEIFVVTINGLPSASAVASNVECVNDNYGTVSLSVSNGNPAYSYAWSNNATTKDLTGLQIGTYTVTVTDANGCSAQTSATVNAVDDIKPQTPTLSDARGECSVTVSAPTTTDNCAGTVTGTTSDPLTYNTQGTYTITWTFSDGHGNSTTATQKVIVKDVTAPVAPTLSDVTGECSATATAPTTTDNCAGTVTGTTSDPLTYTEQGEYTVTWTFSDGHGNSTTATQKVIVKDVTAPVAPTLSDVTGECSATATAPTTTDNCAGTITGTTSDPLTYTEQGEYTITWTFSDGHGNSTTATQKVIVKDVTAPVAPTLADVTGECSATATAPTGTDNCAGIITGTTSDPLTYTEQGEYTITWTFSDGHGNSTTATQKVIVKDVTAPVAPTLSDVTGECSATATAPTGTDNCAGTITGTTSDPLTYTTQGTHTITWTFNDGHGNSTTAIQKVIVKDDVSPVIVCPGDITVGCSDLTLATVAGSGVATATDNCDKNVTITYEDVSTQTESGIGHTNYTITRTWTATDANGNISHCVQTITVSPVIVSSLAGSISCNGGTTTVTITANGGTAPYSGTGTFTVGAGTYTYIVTDANGCSSTTSITVSQPAVLNASANAGTITCNGGTTTVTVSAIGGTAPYVGTGVFTVRAGSYSYTVTDAKGCSSTVSGNITEPAKITVSANAPPSVCAGTSINLSASGGISYSWTGPNGFTSTSQNPVILNATAANAGKYNVTVTNANGCSNTATTGSVVVNICTGIYPTEVSPTVFNAGTGVQLPYICLTTKTSSGKTTITNATPGVFFYYSNIVAPSANFSVYVQQTAPAGLPKYLLNQGQFFVFSNAGATKIATGTDKSGDAVVNITNAVPGSIITLSVKYDAKSIVTSATYPSNSFPGSYKFEAKLANGIGAVANSGSAAIPNTSVSISSTNCSGGVAITTVSPSSILAPAKEELAVSIKTNAFPNPFTDRILFQLNSSISGYGSLELFDLSGKKVAIVFNGNIDAGVTKTVNYVVQPSNRVPLIYKFTIGNKDYTGKLLPTK